MSVDSCADLIITLLYSPGQSDMEGEAIRGITRLQKLIFLLMEEGEFKERMSEEVEFEAYDFGPYSAEVVNALETLKEIRLVEAEEKELESFREVIDGIAVSFGGEEEGGRPQTVEIYRLSDRGMKVGKELFSSLPKEDQASVQETKRKYNQMKLMALLKYVYTNYPETKERSKITDEILGYGRRPGLTPFKRDE